MSLRLVVIAWVVISLLLLAAFWIMVKVTDRKS